MTQTHCSWFHRCRLHSRVVCCIWPSVRCTSQCHNGTDSEYMLHIRMQLEIAAVAFCLLNNYLLEVKRGYRSCAKPTYVSVILNTQFSYTKLTANGHM